MKTIPFSVCVLLAGCGAVSPAMSPEPAIFSIEQKKASVYTTAMHTKQRLSLSGTVEFHAFDQPMETEVCVFVDPKTNYQSFVGIGGALTDASAETFAKLPAEKQEEFLRACYDAEKGLGYSLARTNINSCDFSSSSYTYVKDGDASLKSFSIEPDRKYKIPLIKKAMTASGGRLKLYASPWSPPAWMKDNHSMMQGGKLLHEFRQTWADYYIRFIREYEAEGIPLWGLSVQNEPMARQKWESCLFTAEEERDFISKYLGPTLYRAKMENKKLIAWDHNRDLVYHRASTILDDGEAAKYVWGIGFHWYETWTGSEMQHENVKKVKDAYPSANLIFTEGCIEKFDFEKLNEWWLGEKYGRSMINDFNSGAVGWTDWNVLLDERGGPNHADNFCFAPVIADTRTGELHYTNIYYYIGHFSRFIKEGAKRIAASSNRDKLLTTAFLNPDGSVVVVVMNGSDEKMNYKLWMQNKAADVVAEARSITSYVIR